MTGDGLEGTLVLERMAAIDRIDEFYEAIDADDFAATKALMRQAGLDAQTICDVLAEMAASDGAH